MISNQSFQLAYLEFTFAYYNGQLLLERCLAKCFDPRVNMYTLFQVHRETDYNYVVQFLHEALLSTRSRSRGSHSNTLLGFSRLTSSHRNGKHFLFFLLQFHCCGASNYSDWLRLQDVVVNTPTWFASVPDRNGSASLSLQNISSSVPVRNLTRAVPFSCCRTARNVHPVSAAATAAAVAAAAAAAAEADADCRNALLEEPDVSATIFTDVRMISTYNHWHRVASTI